MSTTAETIRNGVDTEQLFGTLDAVKADPSLAKFQFRARNRWLDGAHNRTRRGSATSTPPTRRTRRGPRTS